MKTVLSLDRIVTGETPTPAVDGETVLFSTAYPYVPGTLRVAKATVRQTAFTETTNQSFTMTEAPGIAEPLLVDYIKL